MRLRYHCQMVTKAPTTCPWVLDNVGNQLEHSGMMYDVSVICVNRQVVSNAPPYKMYGAGHKSQTISLYRPLAPVF